MLTRTVKLANYSALNVIRRNSSVALTFENILSQENLLHLKKRLHDQENKITIAEHLEKYKNINKKAAVLVPLCIVNDVPSILLTLRSSKLSNHSGQVSFPGGMRDEDDEDLVRTALREAEEEVGLSKSVIDVLGQIPPLPGKNFDVLVTPVIGFCGKIQLESLQINEHEVVEVFAPSLESLCRRQSIDYIIFNTSKAKYKLPVFLDQKHKVWGVTALILHHTLQILMPELFTNKFNILS